MGARRGEDGRGVGAEVGVDCLEGWLLVGGWGGCGHCL